jgi:soluble lytic murein transglycosylase-like protein
MKSLLFVVLLQASPGADGSPPYPDSMDVVETARRLIEASLPLSAGDLLSRELSQSRVEVADPGRVLLAARAYAGGRAWPAVLRLLLGQPWLDAMDSGRGLLEIGRAYAGLDSLSAALAAYQRYLDVLTESGDAASEIPVQFRAEYASVLSQMSEHAAAASQYEIAAKERPELARWFRLSALQELARAGELDRARSLAADLERNRGVPGDSVRMELALAAFHSGDSAEGLRLAERLPRRTRATLSAEWVVPALLESGDSAGAIRTLEGALGPGVGSEVGELLLALSPGWQTRRAVAKAELEAGRPQLAVGHLKVALAQAPSTESVEIRLELAEAQFAARDNQGVVWTLAPWMEGAPVQISGVDFGSLWLLAGRAFSRMGAREAAEDAFRRSLEAGTGNESAFAAYLLADHLQDDGKVEDARATYERAISRFAGSSWAARALVRLGMLAFLEGDFEEAQARFDLYLRRYPRGSWYHAMLYWSARALDANGDSAAARMLYRKAVDRDALSYYGQLAARRIEVDPYEAAVRRDGPPPEDLAPEWRRLLARMDELRDLGWIDRAEGELDSGLRESRLTKAQRLPLALALNERAWTRRGIRLGLAAHGSEGRLWSEAALRAVYPLPYREAIEELSSRRGLDVALVAGLIRRESLFEADVVSSAGAVGLMQLLPRTALEIRREAGLDDFLLPQLEVPEANLRLGTAYLARMLDRFDGYLAAALISYNAGPHRYLRWRDFPERDVDPELFVERIPFRETRIYTKEVTANALVYTRLYALAGARVDGLEPGR